MKSACQVYYYLNLKLFVSTNYLCKTLKILHSLVNKSRTVSLKEINNCVIFLFRNEMKNLLAK